MAKGDHRFKGISYNAPVVLTFSLISLVILLIDQWTGANITYQFFCVYRSPISFPFFIRLFGHCLGHSGWSHYTGNIALILLLGPSLEEKYGSKRLLLMIFITAIISGLLNIMLFPNTALLGASGICFMMIVLMSASCMKDGKIPLTMILVILIYIGQEIYTGITTDDNVSQLTHVIGGICGAAFGFIFNGRRERS